jgi:glycosyltransferase involved in cell wall biosynthesis
MGTSGPKVTIVIPFYNDPYVTEAVDSALAQTYGNLEVIVVDDGSTMHADKLKQYQGRIYYLGKANGGTASALNHGFRYASGKYIAWLSSDDRVYPQKVERQVKEMERRGALISHTGFDTIDAGGKLTKLEISPPSSESGDFYRALQSCNPVNGCTVMMRKSLFDTIGNFDEQHPFTHDLDYWYRVLLAGIPFHLLAEPLSAYRWHDNMGTMRNREAIERETAMTFAKYEKRWLAYIARLGVVPQANINAGKMKSGL